MKALIFAILAVSLTGSLSASAQEAPAAPPHVGRACKADFQQFCPNLTGQARRSCIKANLSKMSADCQTALNAMQAGMADIRKACHADIKQYCGGAAPGRARHQCIEQNQTNFSSGCQAALAQAHGQAPAAPEGQPPAPPPADQPPPAPPQQ